MTTLIDKRADAHIREICEKFHAKSDALIEILHRVQEAYAFISRDAEAVIADALNITKAEVRGVVSFYHDFRTEPPAKRTIKICRAEACQATGVDQLIAYAETKLGVRINAKSAGDDVTLEAVYCLGNCALGPAALVGDTLYGRLTRDRIEALIKDGVALRSPANA